MKIKSMEEAVFYYIKVQNIKTQDTDYQFIKFLRYFKKTLHTLR